MNPLAEPEIQRLPGTFMNKLSYLMIATVLLILVGGVVFLATWEMPAPSGVVEKVIPDDRFPR